MGEEDRAVGALEEALSTLESMLEAEPDDPRLLFASGTALALLGRGDEAVARGRRGMELWSRELDAMAGSYGLIQMMEIHALAGHRDEALATLEELLSKPFPWGRITMSMGPWLYRLHEDPGFHALLGTS
jgi:tetratricopeptide (TPR) repeat protein